VQERSGLREGLSSRERASLDDQSKGGTWLPVSLSRRTFRGPVLSIPLKLTARYRKPKPVKIFRNPLLYARELRDRMTTEGINRAELARRLGVSRARVTQWLELLELPERVLREVEALGDHWQRQVVTERKLRRTRTVR